MATVKVRTGAVSAMDDPESLPVEKWDQLVRARYRYLAINLPSDCSYLLQFVHEAERLKMWEKVEHVDMTTGDRRPYKDMNDFICNAFELDPEKVQWAIDGWRMLKPSEPVPFEVAITAGKKAQVIERINQHPDWNDTRVAESIPCSRSWVQEIRAGLVPVYVESKYMNHGGKRDEQADHSPVDRNYGNSRDGIIGRLKRDGLLELANQVEVGSKSARQAAIEAGFKVPESQLTILKRAWKKASEVERQSFKLFIEEK